MPRVTLLALTLLILLAGSVVDTMAGSDDGVVALICIQITPANLPTENISARARLDQTWRLPAAGGPVTPVRLQAANTSRDNRPVDVVANCDNTRCLFGGKEFPSPSQPFIREWGAEIDPVTLVGIGFVFDFGQGSSPNTVGAGQRSAAFVILIGLCPGVAPVPLTAAQP